MKILKKIYLIIYFIILVGIFCINLMCVLFGGFNVVIFKYGLVYIFLLFLSPLVLIIILLIMKRHRNFIFFIVTMILLFAYIFLPSYFSIEANKSFEEFSSNDWKLYPVVRQVMYKSLINSDIIVGKTPKEAIMILGKPDYNYENVLRYKTKPGYIELIIVENKVVDVVYNTPLD